MHPSLKQLLLHGVDALDSRQRLLQANWTFDKSFITRMWSHPEPTWSSGVKCYKIDSVFDYIWKLPFRNEQLRFREDELSFGSLEGVYLSEFDVAVLLEPLNDQRDQMRATCLAISFDGFQTFHENQLPFV